MKPNQKTNPSKLVVEHSISGQGLNGEREEKLPLKSSPLSPPSTEPSTTQTKHSRYTKKENNGTKSAELPKAKKRQGRHRARQDYATAQASTKSKNRPKSPVSTTSSPTIQSVRSNSDSHSVMAPAEVLSPEKNADFPPLSSVPPSPRSDASFRTPTSYTPTLISQKATVRPPPGLLPPPGFTSSSPSPQSGTGAPMAVSPRHLSPMKHMPDSIPGLELSQSSSMFHLQPESMPSPPLNDLMYLLKNNDQTPQSVLFPAHISDNSLNYREDSENSILNSTLRPPSLTPPISESSHAAETHEEAPEDVQALLGAGSNFNVMNFLDGILSETSQQPNRNDETKDVAAKESIPPFQSQSAGVPLDPWNTSTNSTSIDNSLATIIGRITDVEVTALQGQNDHHETIIAGIPLNSNAPPLLTSSAFQGNSAYAELTYASLVTEVDEEESDSFLEPDSFYSQLLGED